MGLSAWPWVYPRCKSPIRHLTRRRPLRSCSKRWQRRRSWCLFPELGLSAYSCEDLFHQQALLNGTLNALHTVLTASPDVNLIAVIGVPLEVQHLLFNYAVVLYPGRF